MKGFALEGRRGSRSSGCRKKGKRGGRREGASKGAFPNDLSSTFDLVLRREGGKRGLAVGKMAGNNHHPLLFLPLAAARKTGRRKGRGKGRGGKSRPRANTLHHTPPLLSRLRRAVLGKEEKRREEGGKKQPTPQNIARAGPLLVSFPPFTPYLTSESTRGGKRGKKGEGGKGRVPAGLHASGVPLVFPAPCSLLLRTESRRGRRGGEKRKKGGRHGVGPCTSRWPLGRLQGLCSARPVARRGGGKARRGSPPDPRAGRGR